MHPFPHRYAATAAARPAGDVRVDGEGLPQLISASPPEFDGPGDQWSPETLLVAAVADCFVLTFRSVARASKLEWTDLFCHAEGVLDRADGITRFTEFRVFATLELPVGGDEEAARRAMDRAERICLVTNSLNATTHLKADVVFAGAGAEVSAA